MAIFLKNIICEGIQKYTVVNNADTVFLPSIISLIKGVNLLYHETTFTAEAIEKAESTFHSTTFQAATIALEAQVDQLIIGHFSSKYADLNILLEECKTIFDLSNLAIEGQIFKISKKSNFPDSSFMEQ